ncbi:phosphotransferase enzyme family protein [Colletotrichum musicola]|uniref:Phosphotransferase enzyme family protein n=1 Tax=Colletotrichum musicola TaxID=2175873 RepID=A0A8H6NCN6_9PEZI|nr:phosphotransferase enzyme family protein [Colletotrichum musicola]
MAPSEDIPGDIANRVQTSLNGTPYAVSSLKPLAGGLSNFTYHAALLRALEDGSTDVLVKHGEAYMAKFPENPITTDRCDVEAACLKELATVEVCSGESSTAKVTIRAPRCYHYDFSTKTQVQEYLPHVVTLKTHCMRNLQTPAGENAQRDYRLLGKSLAEYIQRAHVLMARAMGDQAGEGSNAHDAATLRQAITSNSEMQKLVHTINYDWLMDRVKQFPEILSDAKGIFVQVKEQALGEIQGGSGSLSVINGDFGPHNVLISDAPVESGCENRLFVVDWENAQFGVEGMDHGYMLGELYSIWLKGADVGLWMFQGYAEGLGPMSEDKAWRIALQTGVYIVSLSTAIPGWSSSAQLEDVARKGRDIIVNAWNKERAWFDGGELACLFGNVTG